MAGELVGQGAWGAVHLIPEGKVCQPEQNWLAAGFIHFPLSLPRGRCYAKSSSLYSHLTKAQGSLAL